MTTANRWATIPVGDEQDSGGETAFERERHLDILKALEAARVALGGCAFVGPMGNSGWLESIRRAQDAVDEADAAYYRVRNAARR